MKLSEAIAMVEEWLDEHTYNYEIYKIETIEGESLKWQIRFYEYSPFGNIECDTYFYISPNKRSIFNALGNDVLDIGRSAYDYDKEMMQWFDEFERRWNYGNETTD